MATFKCKMCGGSLEITEGTTVCTCDYCGTEQTLPRLDSDKKANLYDRANHFRRNNDFDKAMGIYEQILNEDNTDSEAYWSLVICKYGIEYVEDPSSHKRIPTVNRAQFTSIFDDENYKSALENADSLQKSVYEQEAQAINEIQKGILAISSKEEPFDVFICYKETDDSGRRTPDSVLANDLYHQLTQEGFKVFFARITLEDKLGQEYEPYIFAALNSSKVMVVLGTKPEYYNAVWVKNEWARYLALIKNGAKKMLIPAYRDMDPYDLPDEFSHLQAQDMSKLGFMQDLIRGIKKILGSDKPKAQETVVLQQNTNSNIVALIKRGNMALEDKEWDRADGFFEDVLNQDAENGEAFFGKLLIENKCSNADQLKAKLCGKYEAAKDEEILTACNEKTEHINQQLKEKTVPGYLLENAIKSEYEHDLKYKSVLENRRTQQKQQLSELDNNKLINRCKKYATGTTKEKLDEILGAVENILTDRVNEAETNDKENKERIIKEYDEVILSADKKVNEWYESAINKREADYQAIVKEYEAADTEEKYLAVQKKFKKMPPYKDNVELAEKCTEDIKELKYQKIYSKYENAKLPDEFDIVKQSFLDMKGYKDTEALAQKCDEAISEYKYQEAIKVFEKAINEKDYKAARSLFLLIGNYKDTDSYVQRCRKEIESIKDKEQKEVERKREEERRRIEKDNSKRKKMKIVITVAGVATIFIIISLYFAIARNKIYKHALELKESGKYIEAYQTFEKLEKYKDSEEQMYLLEKNIMQNAKVGDKVYLGNYKRCKSWVVLSKEDNRILILADKCVAEREYNKNNESITWEGCTLRTWLNNDFYDEAFSDEEKTMIIQSTIENDDNLEYGTSGGADTEDYVFLLSIEEAEEYFSNDNDRIGTYEGSSAWWWLRSPGNLDNYAAFVHDFGYVSENGYDVHYVGGAVRPALWISLD